jgi:lysyl-tRNA synthetase class 1
MELLNRTGHKTAVQTQAASIRRELEYIDRWLDRFAPDNVKFALLQKCPEIAIDKSSKEFLNVLATELESSKNLVAEEIHQAVYDNATKLGLKPAEAFKLIYRLFIGKDYGPKVGFFLSSLERDFVINRLRRQS